MNYEELCMIIEVARFNGLQTMGELIAFYNRMKQGNETIKETLYRHTREVLGLE